MIPEYGKGEAQSWLQGTEKNNNIWNCITLLLTLALYFKMFSVALSGLVLICNFFEETFLLSLGLLANSLLKDTSWISYIPHLFSLRPFQTVETTPVCKSRDDRTYMQFRNSSTARSPSQGWCNVLQHKNLLSRSQRKKASFLAII